MDILYKIYRDIDTFVDMLKKSIGRDDITYKKLNLGMMFFIGESSLLHMEPGGNSKLINSYSPQYGDKIEKVLESFEKMSDRNHKIDTIIKKES